MHKQSDKNRLAVRQQERQAWRNTPILPEDRLRLVTQDGLDWIVSWLTRFPFGLRILCAVLRPYRQIFERFQRRCLAHGRTLQEESSFLKLALPEVSPQQSEILPGSAWGDNKESVADTHERAEYTSGVHEQCEQASNNAGNLRAKRIELRFATGPLNDTRGIGRVSREILARLKNAQEATNLAAPKSTPQRKVFFYSAVQWCPNQLPEPSVVMIHDVIPLLFPQFYPRAILLDWQKRYRLIAQQAARIVTISQASAEDIVEHLGVSPEKVVVIHNGVTALPEGDSPAVIPTLPAAPFLAFVGAFDLHKNLEVVFQALTSPRMAQVHLVLIGNNQRCQARVKRLGLQERVHFLHQVSDQAMREVIKRALALVFPSLYEGFGLPPLEAALLGTPAICSRRPAMTELLEEAALFADPHLPAEWVEAIEQLMARPNLRQELALKAQLLVKSYTWESAVAQLQKVLIRVATDCT